MSRLKSLFEELGFTNVSTFIASGNVVFETKATSADGGRLERQIEKHLASALGYDVDTFIRSDRDLAAIVAFDPFPRLSKDGANVHIAFLKEPIAPAVAKKFAAIGDHNDAFAVKNREYFWLRRGRMTDSKIWETSALKALKIPQGTMRNMTTIWKLAAKHAVIVPS